METVLTIVAIMVGIVGTILTAALICWIIDRVTLGRPPTKEEIDLALRQHRERLLAPRWAELEGHFHTIIPQAVRDFYKDHDRLLDTDFYAVPPDKTEEADFWYIDRFEPADLESLENAFPLIGQDEDPNADQKRFAFASDGFGNSYFIELAPTSSANFPVFFFEHDGGYLDRVADSLAEYVSWERRHELAESVIPQD
jgi:hypothetical protein